MITRLLLLIVLACMCSGCSKADNQDSAGESNAKGTVAVPVFTKQDVVSSRRSRNAIARVAPSLLSSF
ncbi:hypothetical protein JYT61_00860, partial [bacterium AH-315-E10]|nr:hypothetical protein [bacterium AH-315-E10]